MELKVPFLADRQLESAATELLRKYAKWKPSPASCGPRPSTSTASPSRTAMRGTWHRDSAMRW